MSIIFETEDGEIIMYCKGADNALLNVMNQNEK